MSAFAEIILRSNSGNEEFISSGRLDDMWMVYTGLKGLVDSNKTSSTKMMVCLDNEEIGSLTAQGAASNFHLNVIERIVLGLGHDREAVHRVLSNSMMISADL
jgi:aspartyl aminopeptidase